MSFESNSKTPEQFQRSIQRRVPRTALSSDHTTLLEWNPLSDYGVIWEHLLNYHHGTKSMKSQISTLFQLAKENDLLANEATENNKEHRRIAILGQCNKIVEDIAKALTLAEQEAILGEWNQILAINDTTAFQQSEEVDDLVYMERRLSESMMTFAMILSCITRGIEINSDTVNLLRSIATVVVFLHDTLALYRKSDLNIGKSIYNHLRNSAQIDRRIVLLFAEVMCGEMRLSALDPKITSVFTDFVRAHVIAAATHPWYGICHEIADILTSSTSSDTEVVDVDAFETCSLIIRQVKHFCEPRFAQDWNNLMMGVLEGTTKKVMSLLSMMTLSFRANLGLFAKVVYPDIVSRVKGRGSYSHGSAELGTNYAIPSLDIGVSITIIENVSVIFAVLMEAELSKNVGTVTIFDEGLLDVAAAAMDLFCDERELPRQARDLGQNLLRESILLRKSIELRKLGSRVRLDTERSVPSMAVGIDEYVEARCTDGIWKWGEWVSHYCETTSNPKSWLYQTSLKLYLIAAFEMLSIKRRVGEDGGAGIINHTNGTVVSAIKALYCTANAGYIDAVLGYSGEIDSLGQRVATVSWISQLSCLPGGVMWDLLEKPLPSLQPHNK